MKSYQQVNLFAFLLLCLGLATLLVTGCGTMTSPATTTSPVASSRLTNQTTSSVPSDTEPKTSNTSDALSYCNFEFGFEFFLPDTWQNYTIVQDQWRGYALEGPHSGEVTEQGPLLLIRHPLWSETKPYQDIPVMVFTLDQWDQIDQETLSVSAAPIPPQEFGRNDAYVFALPARYNFAYLEGTKEVEKILAEKPLQPFPVHSSSCYHHH